MIKIRPAIDTDAANIALLGKMTFKESFGHLFDNNGDLKNYLSKTFSNEKIRSGLAKEKNKFFIAFKDNQPAGYAKLKLDSPSIFVNDNHISQLQKIYVLKEFLGLKIGKQLQSAVFEEANVSGAKKIWLSVWIGNQRAINFYRKGNWEDLGQHTFAIGSHKFDFLAMIKDL